MLDTNVLIDLYTSADLASEYEKSLATPDAPTAIFRRARVRESLILACHLHETSQMTWGLASEMTQILTQRSDPEALRDFNTHFTTWFIWFVKDYVLNRWDSKATRMAAVDLKGSACDDFLIDLCKRSGVPLITNEGYTATGVSWANPKQIPAKAIAAGVAVYTPRQFWLGKINPRRAARRFLARFDKNARLFVLHRRKDRQLPKTLQDMRHYYEHVLFGLTSNPAQRLAIELSGFEVPRRCS